jgi:type VI protein secretion system component Hcp
MAKLFLKLDNVMGPSREPGHVQWIELLSISVLRPGPSRPDAADSRPESKYEKPPVEFQCLKLLDASSSALLKLANDGSAVGSATVEFVDDKGVAKIQLSFRNVRVTSFSTRAAPPTFDNSMIDSFRFTGVVQLSVPYQPSIQPMATDRPYYDLINQVGF